MRVCLTRQAFLDSPTPWRRSGGCTPGPTHLLGRSTYESVLHASLDIPGCTGHDVRCTCAGVAEWGLEACIVAKGGLQSHMRRRLGIRARLLAFADCAHGYDLYPLPRRLEPSPRRVCIAGRHRARGQGPGADPCAPGWCCQRPCQGGAVTVGAGTSCRSQEAHAGLHGSRVSPDSDSISTSGCLWLPGLVDYPHALAVLHAETNVLFCACQESCVCLSALLRSG